jgi:hypothetical protein
MKRKRADKYQFAVWAAANLMFKEGRFWRTGGLRKHWEDYAQRVGAESGSAASFRNEMSKIGCPWLRTDGRTRRMHQHVELVFPDYEDPPYAETDPDRAWFHWCCYWEDYLDFMRSYR